MHDAPSSDIPGDYSFETSVVCRKGNDAGKVYAVIVWGFTVDQDLKVTRKKGRIFNKPTKEFGRAVDAWNRQAEGPVEKRNAPGQKPLPALR